MKWMSIAHAAERAGYSVRHFRRIAEEDRIRIIPVKGGNPPRTKFFIMEEDFLKWKESKKPPSRY